MLFLTSWDIGQKELPSMLFLMSREIGQKESRDSRQLEKLPHRGSPRINYFHFVHCVRMFSFVMMPFCSSALGTIEL